VDSPLLLNISKFSKKIKGEHNTDVLPIKIPYAAGKSL